MATDTHVLYYKNSLLEAEKDIKESKKALKDTVGLAFENHRKRIWTYFGFSVTKSKLSSLDWDIYYNGKLVALEEDKGHYLDACFLERALSGLAKTVLRFQKKQEDIPIFVIHSFAKNNRFDEKVLEDLETRKDCISNEIKKKLVYTTLTDRNRLPRDKWFPKVDNCYTRYANNQNIIKDIEFIISLRHQCQTQQHL